jgi:hypothetical protein
VSTHPYPEQQVFGCALISEPGSIEPCHFIGVAKEMRVGRSWPAYLYLDRSGFCVMKESLIEIATGSRFEWRVPKKIIFGQTKFWL